MLDAASHLPAEWALLGGLLAVVRMSWFSYFGNSYWGGSVAILGGCLVLGATARLARKCRLYATDYGWRLVCFASELTPV